MGGIGEGGDLAVLQVAWRDDFKGAVFGELAKFGGDAFEQTFAERSEFGVGVGGGEGKDRDDFSLRERGGLGGG